MNITEIRLINFRCFEELAVTFDRNLTVLIGDNGNGKTAILDAIAIGISPFVGAFSQGKRDEILPDDVRRTTDPIGQMVLHHPARIEMRGFVGGREECWARDKKSPKGRTTIKEATNIIDYAKTLAQFSDISAFPNLPLIRYYGVCRLCLKIKSAIPKQNPRKYAERVAGYLDCLESASGFAVFQRWFIAATHAVFQWEQAALQHQEWDESRKKLGEHWRILRNTVRSAINRVLEKTGWQDIEYDAALQKIVMFHKEQGILGVDQMSSGIRTMIGLVADLTYRAVKLNAHLRENAVAEAEGIVLIDEIDLHLHPSWQQHVIGDLLAVFPKIQFIITTHSPQVLTTLRKESIRVLSCDDNGIWCAAMPPVSPFARDSGDALAYVMGVQAKPPLEILDQVHLYEQLVRAGKITSPEAMQLKRELDAAGYEIPGADIALWEFFARQVRMKQGC